MTQESVACLMDRVHLSPAALDTSGEPILTGDEKIEATFDNVCLVVGSDQNLGPGTLYTTERRVIWASVVRKAVAVTFPEISMHAISRDTTFYEKACVFCQLDQPEDLAAHTETSEDLDSYELKLVPSDEQQVDALFKALCDGAEKNPDDMEEDEGDFFFDEEEVMNGLDEEGLCRLQALEDRLQLPSPQEFDELVAGDPGRFDDNDDDQPVL